MDFYNCTCVLSLKCSRSYQNPPSLPPLPHVAITFIISPSTSLAVPPSAQRTAQFQFWRLTVRSYAGSFHECKSCGTSQVSGRTPWILDTCKFHTYTTYRITKYFRRLPGNTFDRAPFDYHRNTRLKIACIQRQRVHPLETHLNRA